ncbi:hypothetical protein CBO05C_1033 [Clostridium botulinum B str. Osaka05]|uniref:Uncharacterized protein n=1 Tax=Clostridium botulinum B str. Osaka05 TaxID=1407017 RepID=A0A0S6U2T2_CLOBO|nr:hypothetical protein CBO05C_1033 [Clostridium botulinum B str. Osaka05]
MRYFLRRNTKTNYIYNNNSVYYGSVKEYCYFLNVTLLSTYMPTNIKVKRTTS